MLEVVLELAVAVALAELDPAALLDDLVADFAVAVEDADVAELLIEFVDEEAEVAEVAEEADDAEEAVVMLAVTDALELAVID